MSRVTTGIGTEFKAHVDNYRAERNDIQTRRSNGPRCEMWRWRGIARLLD